MVLLSLLFDQRIYCFGEGKNKNASYFDYFGDDNLFELDKLFVEIKVVEKSGDEDVTVIAISEQLINICYDSRRILFIKLKH